MCTALEAFFIAGSRAHTPLVTTRQRRPRQQAAICYLLCTLAFAASSAAYIIGDSDPSVVYTPSELGNSFVCVADGQNSECANRWWVESLSNTYHGAVKSTNGPNASLRVTFKGAKIEVVGVTDRRGGSARASVDGGSFSSIGSRSQDRGLHTNAVLFSAGSLDPNLTHTLTIEYDPTSSAGKNNPHLLRIDYFDVAEADDGSVGFPPNPLPSSSAGGLPINSVPSTLPNTPATNTSNGVPSPTGSVVSETEPTDKSSSSTIPIVAGLSTGAATLAIASAVIFFLLRRRRAVRIESMQLPRSTPQMSTRRDYSNSRGMANLVYAFNRRGSSVASSAEAPAPGPPPMQSLPPVPPLNTYMSPYTYQRQGRPYPRSVDSSIGPPVDERPPNIPEARSPISPIAGSGRVLRVYNPDGSTVVSSSQGH
ncbi:hypothetical protein BKA62DRAFT_698142 [Auriculariales sp. MPI-PUGE-AT-0066]|nr:hypothetical protein BKA62DRAFT_698142 [Auriculariales sp. MPI-PUGE-AT-0066]